MDFLCCGLQKRDEQAHGPVSLRQRGKSVQHSGSFRKAGPLQRRGVPGNASSGGHEGSTETPVSSSWTPTLDSFQRSLATLEQAMSPSASESNEGRNSWDVPAVRGCQPQANSAVSGGDPKQKESRTAGVTEETDKEQMRDAKLKIKQAVAATADARKEMQDLCEKIKEVQESQAAKRFEMDQNSTASATDPATKKRYETQLATLTGQLEGHKQRMSQLRESLREGMELEKEAKNRLKTVSQARLAVFGASGSGSFRQTQNKSSGSGSGSFRKSVSARSESSPRKAEPLKRSTSLKKT